MRYGDLAAELGMPNARNLNFVLGAVGNSMIDLAEDWGRPVPRIQALVVNKDTGMPGEGFSPFAPDPKEFRAAPAQLRRRIVDAMLADVFSFSRWDDVLKAFGLTSVPAPLSMAPSVEEVLQHS